MKELGIYASNCPKTGQMLTPSTCGACRFFIWTPTAIGRFHSERIISCNHGEKTQRTTKKEVLLAPLEFSFARNIDRMKEDLSK